ncbi:unnamed protein product [Kuraishia capsulata CBS 1993]|uniref:ATP synthase subunit epsilon, mitochondrial n=1 Tax=Kuraishia capsulata CBS 1993 TaxID=1382522 RepID=W6MF44_9ASCO|nr:uncharacterized protein KUCA_T00000204001 [Kuraishia capsulata CBS 1993]CDK24244.1 unnamed protein product [Kuraishia capsulata CBS 1993]
MSSWQKAGFSFNKYLSIAARTVRRSLKEDLRVASEKRDFVEAKVQVLENGSVTKTTDLSLTK